jgi:hypothetical protein
MAVLQDMSNDYPELKSILRPPDHGGQEGPGPDQSPAPAPPAK